MVMANASSSHEIDAPVRVPVVAVKLKPMFL